MEKFLYLKKANSKHNNKYDYSLIKDNDNDINLKKVGFFICPVHGKFEQKYKNHLYYGCPYCGNSKKKNNEIFEKDAKEIHGNIYDYSLLNYKNNKNREKIICPIHGIFYKSYQEHIRLKQGCPKCSRICDKTTFIEKANIVHNYKYDYSLFVYQGCRKYSTIICPIHGEFKQMPYKHIQGDGCPSCNSSKGELKIEKNLISKNIRYEKQKKFKNCKNKNYLPFDFFLPKYNLCIEFDGKQHFDKNSIYYSNTIKINDNIKNKYCKDNNIKLIRISYNEINKIEKILEKIK